ncbi:MAG: SpaA isopeptide-forming pilin-related protein [Coriobacteriia bacterium]|nr:SpaA isopeptide-forming pilin-related protein [Coriobacteriia bacterium]
MEKRCSAASRLSRLLLVFIILAGLMPIRGLFAFGADDPGEATTEETVPPDQRARALTYAAELDLSTAITGNAADGYTVSAGTAAYDPRFPIAKPDYILTFNTNANEKVYRIYQSGALNAGGKNGTSMFGSIEVPDGVDVTLVIDRIDMGGDKDLGGGSFSAGGRIYLSGSGRLALLLSGQNYIRRYIQVPSTSEIIINSLNGSDTDDRLTMSPKAGSVSTHAGIGGSGGSGSGGNGSAGGTVTINGGAIDITAYSSGACIGGGGAYGLEGTGSTSGGNGGMTTINGGTVSVTQYGSVNSGSLPVGGAGIGGGGGTSINGGDAGVVKITGGKVTVRQHTRGAGIGGGTYGPAGDITIDGGVVDVTVANYPGQSGDGAGIGSAAGSNRTGGGNIVINGGAVSVASQFTGIGVVHNSNPPSACNITITGGTVYSKSVNGPGIGYWGNQGGSTIAITGGTVVAQSEKSTGIGSSTSNLADFHLDAAANVRAYSQENYPAISTQNNRGNGYYVNAGFVDSAVSPTEDTTLNVYADGDLSALLKTLTLPAMYKNFAYSSDIDESRTDNILAQNGSAIIGTVVRAADDKEQIYSVATRAGYNEHNNNAGNGMLPVKLRRLPSVYLPVAGTPSADSVGKHFADLVSTGHALGSGSYVAGGFKYSDRLDGSGRPDSPVDLPWISPFATTTISEYTGDAALLPNTRYYLTTYITVYVDLGLTSGSSNYTFESDEVAEFVTSPSITGGEANKGAAAGEALVSAAFEGGIEPLEVTVYWDTDPIDPGGKPSWAAHSSAILLASEFDYAGFENYALTGLIPDQAYNMLVVIENETGWDSYPITYTPTSPPPDPVDLTFRKADEADAPMKGVVFELYSCSEKENPYHSHDWLAYDGMTGTELCCWSDPLTATSDADGIVGFWGLEPGEYMLVEAKTLPGYQLPRGQWLITIDSDSATSDIDITARGFDSVSQPPAFKSGANGLTLPNYRQMTMPHSGGAGVLALTVAGIMLIGSAVLCAILTRRRGLRGFLGNPARSADPVLDGGQGCTLS